MTYNGEALKNFIEKNEEMVKMVKRIIDVNMAKTRDGIDRIWVSAIVKDKFNIEKLSGFEYDINAITKANRSFLIKNIVSESSSESEIYTDEQMKKIEQLRFEREYEKNLRTEKQAKLDKENSFEIHQKVFFNDMPGIITFVGDINKNGIRKYTVKLQDNQEHRFVAGEYLKERKQRDHIKPPTDPTQLKVFNHNVERFEKMDTKRIIKIKNKMRLNYDDYMNNHSAEKLAALYVLQERGHHQRKKLHVRYDKNK